MQDSNNRIKVIHFQRKSRPGFNFSIESIFEDLRNRLKDKVNFSVKTCSCYNNGYLSKFWNIIEAALRQKKNAITHITGEINFLNLLMRRDNVLLTIHDCRYVERKKGLVKLLVKWLYLKAPVSKAAYITAVSEFTKKEIIRYTNCTPSLINVIPVAVNTVFRPSPKIFNKKCPVILQVGTGENKNLLRVLQAIKDITCRLVIIGDTDKKILEKLNSYKINYIIKSNLSAEELYNEYINADIVSFISLYEGFGMPIIEANCVGRVVITSNISSMPEVAGDAACFADPYNIQDIKNGFLKIIEDEEYREQLLINGRKNKLRFNAQTIADAYFKLYLQIANKAG